MVEDAERLGLPPIELRKVVPFVAVTEAINGLLVNESVRRLQLADRVSYALAAALAAGVDPDDLLEVLGRETDADVELIALFGEPITRTAAGVERSWSGALTASVTTAGVTVATLVLYPRLIGELLMLDAVGDRAPEALGIALLRSRPLSHLERYLAPLPVPGDRKHTGWLPRDRARCCDADVPGPDDPRLPADNPARARPPRRGQLRSGRQRAGR